jgi:transcriptional regulator
MHPNSAFRWEDQAALRAFAQEIGFGMLFGTTADGPRVAHVPFVFLANDSIGFHLARGNALTKYLDGMEGLFVINGPDGYVSPEWYQLDDNQVPTWNYLALELQGPVRRMSHDELMAQIDALTAEQEGRLAPKKPWTRDKMDEDVLDKLTNAIVGFELTITAWRPTAKLGQNKPEAARLAAADALNRTGRKAIAHLMQNLPQ